MDSTKPREVKLVMLGDTGCGKSSLVLRFVTNNFRQFSESTIGASFMSKLLTVNGKSIKFQIWDTAGQVGPWTVIKQTSTVPEANNCWRDVHD